MSSELWRHVFFQHSLGSIIFDRKNPTQQKVWWYEYNFQDEEFSSEPSVQNVDFIKDIKEIKNPQSVVVANLSITSKDIFSNIQRRQDDESWKRLGNPTSASTMSAEKRRRFIKVNLFIGISFQMFDKYILRVIFFLSKEMLTNKWHWTNSTFILKDMFTTMVDMRWWYTLLSFTVRLVTSKRKAQYRKWKLMASKRKAQERNWKWKTAESWWKRVVFCWLPIHSPVEWFNPLTPTLGLGRVGDFKISFLPSQIHGWLPLSESGIHHTAFSEKMLPLMNCSRSQAFSCMRRVWRVTLLTSDRVRVG